jgi:hypothetical protein
MDLVQCSPVDCVQRISNQLGESALHVWLTIHEEGLYPYHLQCVQALQFDDMISIFTLSNGCLYIVRFLIISIVEVQFSWDGINNT